MLDTLNAFDPVILRLCGAAAFVGIVIVLFALFRDRARGRLRCPKCWFDMSGHAVEGGQAIVCPECGKCVRKRKQLQRTRRRRWLACVGAIVVAASSATPKGHRDGMASLLPMPVLTMLGSGAGIEWANERFDQTVIDHWIALEVNRRIDADQMSDAAWGWWMEHVYDEFRAEGMTMDDPAIVELCARLEEETLTFHWDDNVFEVLATSELVEVASDVTAAHAEHLHVDGEISTAAALRLVFNGSAVREIDQRVRISYHPSVVRIDASILANDVSHHRLSLFDISASVDQERRLSRRVRPGPWTSTGEAGMHRTQLLETLGAFRLTDWVGPDTDMAWSAFYISGADRLLLIRHAPDALLRFESLTEELESEMVPGKTSLGIARVSAAARRWDNLKSTPLIVGAGDPHRVLRSLAANIDVAVTADLTAVEGEFSIGSDEGSRDTQLTLEEIATLYVWRYSSQPNYSVDCNDASFHFGDLRTIERHIVRYDLESTLDRLQFHLPIFHDEELERFSPLSSLEFTVISPVHFESIPRSRSHSADLKLTDGTLAIVPIISSIKAENWFDEWTHLFGIDGALDSSILVSTSSQRHFRIQRFLKHLNAIADGQDPLTPFDSPWVLNADAWISNPIRFYDLSFIYNACNNPIIRFDTTMGLFQVLRRRLYSTAPQVLIRRENQLFFCCADSRRNLEQYQEIFDRFRQVMVSGDDNERDLRMLAGESDEPMLSYFDLRDLHDINWHGTTVRTDHPTTGPLLSEYLWEPNTRSSSWAFNAGTVLAAFGPPDELRAIESLIDQVREQALTPQPHPDTPD